MEEFSQPFVDALNHLRNNDKGQIHPQAVNKMSEYSIAGAFGETINPAITTSATTSTILSKVGMSGGSVTYTNLGKDKKKYTRLPRQYDVIHEDYLSYDFKKKNALNFSEFR